MLKNKVFIFLSVVLGGFLGAAAGILLGNFSGGLMASVFWQKGVFFSLLMMGLCFILICVSIYAVLKIMRLWHRQVGNSKSIVNTLKIALGAAFFITYFLQILIWGISTIRIVIF